METRTGNEYWQFNPEARRGAGEYRYNWNLILPKAAEIVRSYKTTGVTLRQLFYRLVAAEMLPNTQASYGSLSAKTAKARRDGWFPALIDTGREITRPSLWQSAEHASAWLADRFMVDRALDQPYSIYIGVEKKGLVAQLFQWFSPLGLPVVALGGYPSQTLVDEVFHDTQKKNRKSKQKILIYAGDFDADGEDLQRDFVARTDCWNVVQRVALTPEQVEEMALPPQPGKWTSARARGFATKYRDLFVSTYGMDLVQIELDAIPPTTLRQIYTDAVGEFFDYELWDGRKEYEAEEQAKIEELADGHTLDEFDDED